MHCDSKSKQQPPLSPLPQQISHKKTDTPIYDNIKSIDYHIYMIHGICTHFDSFAYRYCNVIANREYCLKFIELTVSSFLNVCHLIKKIYFSQCNRCWANDEHTHIAHNWTHISPHLFPFPVIFYFTVCYSLCMHGTSSANDAYSSSSSSSGIIGYRRIANDGQPHITWIIEICLFNFNFMTTCVFPSPPRCCHIIHCSDSGTEKIDTRMVRWYEDATRIRFAFVSLLFYFFQRTLNNNTVFCVCSRCLIAFIFNGKIHHFTRHLFDDFYELAHLNTVGTGNDFLSQKIIFFFQLLSVLQIKNI